MCIYHDEEFNVFGGLPPFLHAGRDWSWETLKMCMPSPPLSESNVGRGNLDNPSALLYCCERQLTCTVSHSCRQTVEVPIVEILQRLVLESLSLHAPKIAVRGL